MHARRSGRWVERGNGRSKRERKVDEEGVTINDETRMQEGNARKKKGWEEGKEENGSRDERRAMSGEWIGVVDEVGKWRTVERDAQREEREDSGWRGPWQGAEERNGKQRERERGGSSGNGSIESAAQRNAPPLLWSGSFAGAPPRPRASEREKDNDSVREGETERRRKRERERN